jgi:predicted ATPase
MNPLLQSFHIRSFRGLKNVSLENLGRINLLVGENNAGKTSILESLLMFAAPGVSRNWLRILNARDVGLSDDNIGEVVSWLFPVIGRENAAEREEIQIEGVSENKRESLRLKFQMETEIVDASATESRRYTEATEETERTRKVAHLFAEWFSEIDGAKSGELIFGHAGKRAGPRFNPSFSDAIKRIRALPVEFVKPHAHRLGRMSVGALTNAVWTEKKGLLVSVLQIFDHDITGVEMVAGAFEPTLVINHRRLGPMPLHAFGDGLRKAVVVTGHAIRAANGILLLDEAETALHVSVQEAFFESLHRLCEELNVQVFLTTHSIEAVDAILAAFDKDLEKLAAFRLERNGQVVAKRFSGESLKDLRTVLGQEIR